MGYGDDIIGTGLARGFAARRKLAAFGDGKKIIWGPWSEEMFRHNPNIAKPGEKNIKKLEWIPHYKGSRMYNRSENGRWVWNYDFKVRPGEFYFSDEEIRFGKRFLGGFVVMEPNVPWQKKVASNKDWGEANYNIVADALKRRGYDIVQLIHNNSRRILQQALPITTEKFRDAISVLSRASLYIGPEGGMHHAAAAVGVRAIVIMGGFIPPSVVGYDFHVNLTGGVEACGNIEPCIHCHNAMKKIEPEQVIVLIEEAAA